jgi:hypothetical protein
MRSHRQLPKAVLLVGLTLCRGALADDKDTAKALFEEGLKQMESKSYDAACPAFEKSQKLDPRPGTLFTLAECESQRGHLAAAYQRYGEYLQVYATLPRDKQAKQGTRQKEARSKQGELEKVIAQLTLKLPADAPADTVVTNDGATLSASEIGSPVLVDPGAHVLTTQAPGGPVAEQRITLEKGEKRSIDLEVKRPAPASTDAPPPPPPPPAAPGTSGRRIATFAAGGVGLAGLVVGGITGGLMISKADVVHANCKDGGGGVELCNKTGAAAGNDAKVLGAVATAGLVVGALGVGVGVVLFVTDRKGGSRKAPSSGVEVRVAPLGTAGAALGVRGSF